MTEILATDPSIKTNAELMLNVANCGYLNGLVLDASYGEEGGFWKKFRPETMVTLDLKPVADVRGDFTCLPFAANKFDTVVLDGPYKLSGTPKLTEFDRVYGIETPTKWQERMALLERGILDCMRVTRGYLLVKCQDQVCSGQVRWQTRVLADYAESLGAQLVDRFDLIGHRIPQPEGRSQVHARRNSSALLVFQKKER